MHNFDDFIEYVQNSNEFKLRKLAAIKNLSEVASDEHASQEKKLAELFLAMQENTLNCVIEYLRAYDEWLLANPIPPSK